MSLTLKIFKMAKLNKEELERDEVVKVLAKIELDALLSSQVVDEPEDDEPKADEPEDDEPEADEPEGDEPEADEPEEEETDKKAEIELPQRKAAKNSK
jgi:hypothetical protein